MDATKTTFLLDEGLRQRLKTVAAARQTTVTKLLTEGAELVLDRYEGAQDAERLRAKVAAARKKLRRGLYSGPSLSDDVDAVVYRVADSRKAKRRR